MKKESGKAASTGWLLVKGRKKVPVTPGHEGGEGPFRCEEAIRIVAEWAERLGDYTAEWYEFRPTHLAVDQLLADCKHELPHWAKDGEITARARAVRAALYEDA